MPNAKRNLSLRAGQFEAAVAILQPVALEPGMHLSSNCCARQPIASLSWAGALMRR